MIFRITFFIGFLSLLSLASANSQTDTIRLSNPSFEGVPFEGGAGNRLELPGGCSDCGFPSESPPDVQPVKNGQFQVSKLPQDGNTYIGMVVRDNDTWERIGQKLEKPLQKGKCYEFSLYLARSEIYLSYSQLLNERYDSTVRANYVEPAKLRIYGGNLPCERAEMLAETGLIRNTKWLKSTFRFTDVLDDYQYIVFEAFYNTPTLVPYNGNILIDNASAIIEMPCDKDPLIAANEPKGEPKINKPPTKPEDPVTAPPLASNTTPAPSKIMTELTSRVTEGQTVRINKLYFQSDSTNMTSDSYEALVEIYDFMKNNPKIVIEIGGHTNTIPPHSFCDQLSTARAKSVADFLNKRGIAQSRLKYKGYGKRKPLTRDVSQNGRKVNQRVEIKILSVNG